MITGRQTHDDGTSARYFGDYVPDAICYLSSRKSFGMYANQAPTVKDMCYLRLTKMIENGDITFDEKIGNQNYVRQDLKHACSVENEFLEECSVVRFKELPNGGRKLLSKKEMNAKLVIISDGVKSPVKRLSRGTVP